MAEGPLRKVVVVFSCDGQKSNGAIVQLDLMFCI